MEVESDVVREYFHAQDGKHKDEEGQENGEGTDLGYGFCHRVDKEFEAVPGPRQLEYPKQSENPKD